jgi:transposase
MPTSVRMEIKPQWEAGPDIRVLDAKLCQDRWIVKANASVEARCPGCGIGSHRRHSAYVRRLQDLPVQGTTVELQVGVTRWRCGNRLCERKTFVGQPDQVFRPRARETRRVADLARLIGYVAGGRPAERLMRQLGLPQGDDRILRNLKRHAASSEKPLRVVGIDDWSWLKGSRYGTIVVDLERHEVVDVIHDRSAKTMAAWLGKHPTIEIVSRDRCGLYAQAARQGASSARQVADRFHLIQNLRLAIEQQLSYNDRPSRAVHNNSSTPRDEGLQLQKHCRMIRIGRRNVRLEQFRRVQELHQVGVNLNKIVEETGLGWRTVAKWLTLEVLPERRLMDPRPTNPARFQDFLARLWNEGCTNGRKLLIEVRKQGYTGSFSHLERLFRKWRNTGAVAPPAPVEAPDNDEIATVKAIPKVSPVTASILCMKPRGQLTPEEAGKVDSLKVLLPNFAVMRGFAMRFRGILRGDDPSKLESWLDDARATGLYGIRRFAQILRRDIDAVRNAISERWSNGQTEGQINRLKTLKRAMYGRAGAELLRARMLPLRL